MNPPFIAYPFSKFEFVIVTVAPALIEIKQPVTFALFAAAKADVSEFGNLVVLNVEYEIVITENVIKMPVLSASAIKYKII